MIEPQHTNSEMNKIDIVAMWISFACLAHCLLLPIVFSILPFIGDVKGNDSVHKILVIFALPISAFSLWRSGGWQVLQLATLAIIGLVLLGSGAFIEAFHDYETPISVIGAIVLAYVH